MLTVPGDGRMQAFPLALMPGTMETYHRWGGSVDAPCYLVGGLIYPHRGGPGASVMLVSRSGALLAARVRPVPERVFREMEFYDLNCSDSTDEEFERRRQVWDDTVGSWQFFESNIGAVPIGVELLRGLEINASHQWADSHESLDEDVESTEARIIGPFGFTGPDAPIHSCLVSINSNPLVVEPFRPPTSVVERLLSSLRGQTEVQAFLLDQLVLGSDERLIDELLLLRPEAAANFLRERADALLKQLLAYLGQPQCGSFHTCIGRLAAFVNEESIPYLREIDRRGHKPYRELGARLQSVLLGMVADLERIRDVGNSGSHGVPIEVETVRIQQEAWTSFESNVELMVRWVTNGLVSGPSQP